MKCDAEMKLENKTMCHSLMCSLKCVLRFLPNCLKIDLIMCYVFEDSSSKVLDELSNEVLDDLLSERLLASLVPGSSSLGLLFSSSRLRYFSCHDAFSPFNFATSFCAPILAFSKSSRLDLNSSLSSLRTVIL
jgi:hypothetical protein